MAKLKPVAVYLICEEVSDMFRILAVCFWVCLVQSVLSVDIDQPNIHQITTDIYDLAEAPMWDPRKNLLFFVNINAGQIFSYNYNTSVFKSVTLNGRVSLVTLSTNDSLLIATVNHSVYAIEWDGTNKLGKQKVLTTAPCKCRFNDGKADVKGRLWYGTMGQDLDSGKYLPNQGALYKITKENLSNPVVEIAPANVSNGLAWNGANTKMYYIDTHTHQVAEFDFDEEKGEISNRKVLFDVDSHPDLSGHPDGMTIDVDDNLWVALPGGGSVVKVSTKTGEVLQRVDFPARDVTSVMWGGPNLDVLFVTTSYHSLKPEERKQYPHAGSVYAVTNLKSRGRPMFRTDIVNSI